MKKLLLLAILATTMIFNVQAQVYKTIHVTTAGTLGSLLTDNEKGLVTNITVTGNIDARDFSIISLSMPKLTALDISTVTIQAYNGSACYQCNPNSYAANEIPPNPVFPYTANQVKSITLQNSITSIGDFAFGSCIGLTSINIPNGVKTIGQGAFSGCTGLTSISLPNSITSIGQSAFSGSGLTSVNIPSGVIGDYAFRSCSGLSSISFGSGVTSIGNAAFSYCNGLINLTIHGSITSIGAAAFYGCSGLTSITIGSGVTSIGDGAFNGCTGLTNVTIPNSVTSIGAHAFDGCSGLTSITIGSGITAIAGSTFLGCTGLTNVIIPNSVTSIGGSAFNGCSGLTSITIGSGITSIDNYAFYNCSVLKTINCLNSIPPTLGPLFSINYNNLSVTDVYVPTDAAVAAYKANVYWIMIFPGNIIKKIPTNTDVKTINSNNLKLMSGKSFIRAEFDCNANVEVYNLSGILLRHANATNTITVDNLNTGLYILKMNGTAYKVVVE